MNRGERYDHSDGKIQHTEDKFGRAPPVIWALDTRKLRQILKETIYLRLPADVADICAGYMNF